MNLKRIARHLLTTRGQVARAFPRSALIAIEKAIEASETAHAGEIRFVVEGALDGLPLFNDQSARGRAVQLFAQLGVWDTENNNGLLLYLLLADRAVEIVADRGIHDKVGPEEWNRICRGMEAAFGQSRFEAGVMTGVQLVTQHLAKHFPSDGRIRNELPDKPLML